MFKKVFISCFIAMIMASYSSLIASDLHSISIDLSDQAALSDNDNIEFTPTGTIKSQVDSDLTQSDYLKRDSDLLIHMPLSDFFEFSLKENDSKIQTYTENTIHRRNNGVLTGDITIGEERDSSPTLHFTKGYVYSILSGINLDRVRKTGFSY